MYSVALSGLSFVNALVPGVNTPVCGLSRHRRFSPDSNNMNKYVYLSAYVRAGECYLPLKCYE